jgi:hypothetical protein
MTTMFAKQAQIAAAAIALTLAGGAFAQSVERNVFDTETNLRMPAAVSANGLTRSAVRAEFIAQRSAGFSPESNDVAQAGDSSATLVALFKSPASKPAVQASAGRSRGEVRAELLAARANGEMNSFDTETNLRVAPSQPAPVTLAQR